MGFLHKQMRRDLNKNQLRGKDEIIGADRYNNYPTHLESLSYPQPDYHDHSGVSLKENYNLVWIW